MSVNYLLPVACPMCSNMDNCWDSCTCPSCFVKHDEDRSRAIATWITLAPAMLALNAADIPWHWSKYQRAGVYYYTVMHEGEFLSVEISVVPWFENTERVIVEKRYEDENEGPAIDQCYGGISAEDAVKVAIEIIEESM